MRTQGKTCVSTDNQNSIRAMFHDHYPDGCPPTGTVPASGTYYRLVDDPITDSALRSQYEEGTGKSCSERGVSFYDRTKGLRRLMDAYPEQHDRKKIALLALKPEWGQMYKSGNKGGYRHVNVWLYRNAPRAEIASQFTLVEGDVQ